MKKYEENLQTAIMNRLDVLGLNDVDEKYKYIAFQFIIDYIKRVVNDSNKLVYSNYDLTTEKNRLTITIDDLEIELEQISWDKNFVSIFLYAFNKPVASIQISVDVIIKNPIIYSVSNDSIFEEYIFNDREEKLSYEYALNSEPKYSGSLVDIQTRTHNKTYFFYKSNGCSKIVKINIPDSLEIIDDIMNIYKILVDEKDKLLKREKLKKKTKNSFVNEM